MYDYLAPLLRRTKGRFPFWKITEYFRKRAEAYYTKIGPRQMRYEGFMITVNPSKYMGGCLWWRGGREHKLLEWAYRNSKPGVFVDVGACLGEWSYYFLRRGRAVHAFEPNYQRAVELCKANGHYPFLVYSYAIGNYPRGALSRDSYNEGRCIMIPGNAFEVRPLDEVVGIGVTLIKVDVEGNERAVLESGRTFLETQKPVVIFENNNDGAYEFLVSLGYREAARFDANYCMVYDESKALEIKLEVSRQALIKAEARRKNRPFQNKAEERAAHWDGA